jgi:hypothetical protein
MLFFVPGLGTEKFKSKKSNPYPLTISLPYLYLVIAGRNISIWVYLGIGLMFTYGGFSIWKKITAKPIPVNA